MERQEEIGNPGMAAGAQRSRESHGRHDPDSDIRVDCAGSRKAKRFPVGRTGNRFVQNHPGAKPNKADALTGAADNIFNMFNQRLALYSLYEMLRLLP